MKVVIDQIFIFVFKVFDRKKSLFIKEYLPTDKKQNSVINRESICISMKKSHNFQNAIYVNFI
jgi:hypothetical protein